MLGGRKEKESKRRIERIGRDGRGCAGRRRGKESGLDRKDRKR